MKAKSDRQKKAKSKKLHYLQHAVISYRKEQITSALVAGLMSLVQIL